MESVLIFLESGGLLRKELGNDKIEPLQHKKSIRFQGLVGDLCGGFCLKKISRLSQFLGLSIPADRC